MGLREFIGTLTTGAATPMPPDGDGTWDDSVAWDDATTWDDNG